MTCCLALKQRQKKKEGEKVGRKHENVCHAKSVKSEAETLDDLTHRH